LQALRGIGIFFAPPFGHAVHPLRRIDGQTAVTKASPRVARNSRLKEGIAEIPESKGPIHGFPRGANEARTPDERPRSPMKS
jgi:hypothetical protein